VERLSRRLDQLSPPKRALLEAQLRKIQGGLGFLGPIPRRQGPGPAPCSSTQERLWILSRFDPEAPVSNRPTFLRLTGSLDVPLLERCLNEIVRRHEVLRSRIEMLDGAPVQRVTEPLGVPLPVVDLRHLTPAEREPEILRRARDHARKPFDLGNGPLIRASLVRLDDQVHLLLLNIHHIAFDGWSSGVLMTELGSLWDAFAAGRPSPLPELPIQYADFACWQRKLLESGAFGEQLAYWKKRLSGAPTALEFPTDRPRPPFQTYRGGQTRRRLSGALTEALRDLARGEGATLFMTLLAAFQALLHRYTSQEDILVGSPIAGRSRLETEGLIGCFINILVLRADLTGDPSFRRLLGRVRQTSLEAYTHQDLPFQTLVQEIRPERDPSRHPFVQVTFQLRNLPRQPDQARRLRIEACEFDVGVAEQDLSLELTETPPGLDCLLKFNADLFDARTADRMLDHFQFMLEGIVTDPDQPISMLPILPEAERHRLVVEWNDTATALPRDRCLVRMFEAQVERTHDVTAVEFEDRRLTYGQLNVLANRLAHRLRRLGVGRGMLVGICVDRGPDMVAGLLGILKAGGAYLPLDPDYPRKRLAFMITDAQLPVIVTQLRLTPTLASSGARLVCLDEKIAAGDPVDDENPGGKSTPEDLAYVIYTSGSTGQPKGVLVTHGALINLLVSMQHTLGVTGRDVLLAVSTLSFDIAALELFLPLILGARIALVDRDTAADGVRLARRLARSGATILQGVPATWRLLLEGSWSGTPGLTMMSGGEALPRDLANQLLGKCAAVWNVYGPTETTIWSSAAKVEAGEGPVPIGRPIANTQIYVLDTRRQPVPIGLVGEIYIGGHGVALGYLNRPGLTAERFVPDRFGTNPDGRLFRTGDLARWRHDGLLECLGRIDHQVKIRGIRVEPGEIEVTLRRHPAVREAVVVARGDDTGEKVLIAYVVASQRFSPSAAELRSWLRESLPGHVVPSYFVMLESLPLTPNRKVDRSRLPAPQVRPSEPDADNLTPRTPTEATLAAIWAEVLRRPSVGIRENYFDLGGHSLIALRMFNLIRERFNLDLPLTSLFQRPTVEQLAALIDDAADLGTLQQPLVPLQPEGSRIPFFCVHGIGGAVHPYHRLAQRLGPDQPFYGLSAQSLDSHLVETSIEAIASAYINEVRTVLPAGRPFMIGGFSLGGAIAFEMAQQLKARGEEVALLVMIDASPPNLSNLIRRSRLRFACDTLMNLPIWIVDNLLRSDPKRALNRMLGRASTIRRTLSVTNGQGGDRLPEVDPQVWFGVKEIPEPMMQIVNALYRARCRYESRPYPGKVTLIRTRWQPLLNPREPMLGWDRIAQQGVEVHVVPGTHTSCLEEPHVETLAGALAECLERAGAKVHDGRSS